jgi:hypothetical protein
MRYDETIEDGDLVEVVALEGYPEHTGRRGYITCLFELNELQLDWEDGSGSHSLVYPFDPDELEPGDRPLYQQYDGVIRFVSREGSL